MVQNFHFEIFHSPMSRTLSVGWKDSEIEIFWVGTDCDIWCSCLQTSYPFFESEMSQTRTSALKSPEAKRCGFVGWNTTLQHVLVWPKLKVIFSRKWWKIARFWFLQTDQKSILYMKKLWKIFWYLPFRVLTIFPEFISMMWILWSPVEAAAYLLSAEKVIA